VTIGRNGCTAAGHEKCILRRNESR
jgi:hypothetical protein